MAETIKSGINYKKLIGGILGVVAVVISRAHPPDPLNLNSMMFLGTFACAVTWWLFYLASFPTLTWLASCVIKMQQEHEGGELGSNYR